MDLTGKKVGVFGLGVSGTAVIDFLQKFKLDCLLIVNAGLPDTWNLNETTLSSFQSVEKLSQEIASDELASCDYIILSPGIPREHNALKKALLQSVPIWNEVELAYHFFKGDIIAVTGTNGKTTTVSFLAQAFESTSKKVFLGGNIGTPFVKAIDNINDYDVAILELSSFQCESLDHFKAKAYLYLNLFENHGERYDLVDDYRLAKWQMVKNAQTNSIIIAGEGSGDCPFHHLENQVKRYNDNWDQDFQKKFSKEDILVVGVHNRYNFYGAYQIFKSFNLEDIHFKKTLAIFPGVEHRLERLKNVQVVFNDAKSTNELALKTAVAAVFDSFGKMTLIMGGRKRHDDDLPNSELVNFLESHCQRVLCIGESAKELQAINDKVFLNVVDIQGAKKSIHDDDVVLFSPGYPSFDQFKNYIDRGLSFKKIFEE